MAQHLLSLPFARRLVRLTTPTELDREAKLAAKRLDVDLQGKTPRISKREIRDAERDQNAIRQAHDVAQDRILAKMESGKATKQDLDTWTATISGYTERARLRARYRKNNDIRKSPNTSTPLPGLPDLTL